MKKLFCIGMLAASVFAFGCGGGGGGATVHPDAKPIVVPTPDAQSGCDPVMQDCTAANTKCAEVETATMPAVVITTQCIPLTGMIPVGSDCMRISEAQDGVGHDNCDKGEFCSGLGHPANAGTPTGRTCRKICKANADCTTMGEHCNKLSTDTPPAGFCLPGCTMFGTDCGTGTTCTFTSDVTGAVANFCTGTGPLNPFDTCMGLDCPANSDCFTDATTKLSSCLPFCDTAGGATGTHPCPMGKTCTANGFPAPNGICK